MMAFGSRYINGMLDVHSANYISREGLQCRQPGYIHGPINLSDADGYARNNRRTSNYAAGNNRASTAPETVVAPFNDISLPIPLERISTELKTRGWGRKSPRISLFRAVLLKRPCATSVAQEDASE